MAWLVLWRVDMMAGSVLRLSWIHAAARVARPVRACSRHTARTRCSPLTIIRPKPRFLILAWACSVRTLGRIHANTAHLLQGRPPFVESHTTQPWHTCCRSGAVHPNRAARTNLGPCGPRLPRRSRLAKTACHDLIRTDPLSGNGRCDKRSERHLNLIHSAAKPLWCTCPSYREKSYTAPAPPPGSSRGAR
jgi:hypothetical protein